VVFNNLVDRSYKGSNMSSISAVASATAAKYVAPTKTAVDADGDHDGSTSKAEVETAQKAVSSISLKGSVINKTA
jgi:hypothetical protein